MPKVVDFVDDRIYLFQFGRARCIPSISPPCLKAETWLRFAHLSYETIPESFGASSRGQKPYIEFNGEEIADSSNLIQFLSDKYNKETVEKSLSPLERATAHAMSQMIEYNMFWQCLYLRSLDYTHTLFSTETSADSLPAFLPTALIKMIFERRMAPRMDAQGVSRRPLEENVKLTIENLTAFSDYLEQKKYMTGDQPTKYDATAFGFIGQMYFAPMKNEVKTFVMESPRMSNVRAYMENIKKTYYPDWENITKNLEMNSEWMKKQL